MQKKTRCLIESKRHPGNFLNRKCDALTHDLDAAVRFRDESEASEFLLNGIYSPEDKENYTYALIEITTKRKEVDPNDREHEYL